MNHPPAPLGGQDRPHPYPHFAAALRTLGPTNRAIAERLGRSSRMVEHYLAGSTLPPVQIVKRFEQLDHALTLDLAPDRIHRFTMAN